MSRPVLTVLLVFGLGLGVGWWLGRRELPPQPATAAAVAMPAISAASPGRVPAPAADPGLPPLTPQERQAFEAREVERSAAADAPRAYRGIDGKPRAFSYPDQVAAESAERSRQARREQLMRELEADPARFAREHRLSLKQVQWIADGDADFPDELLEP